MTNRKSPIRGPSTLFEELEPRLLLSADGLAGLEAVLGREDRALGDDGGQVIPVHQEYSTAPGEESQALSADAADIRREVVFVDGGIEDHETLLAGLFGNADPQRQIHVVVLDPARDGIVQISEALAGYDDLDAVHVLSHGDDASLRLGNATLDAESLDGYRETVATWANALDSQADLLFYGCNLAAGEDGRALIGSLAELTGADVAASDDLTGDAALGGDWVLEFASGDVQAAVAVDSVTQGQWNSVLGVFNVTSIADSGAGTLRQAIVDANASIGPDTIEFNIAGGDHTIALGSALPDITDTVTIDGFSEPDAAASPIVRIDGNAFGGNKEGLTFADGSDGSTVRGLMITRFDGFGIEIDPGADGITIAGNWIGTTGTGSVGVGNNDSGINVRGANTIIGGLGANDGNVITNNGNEGINLTGTGATGTIIQGNIIGLDPDGASGPGNTDVGIAVLSGAHNTVIGGTTIEARNVISNNFEGIEINSNDNVVQGNYIGTDITGLLDRGNFSDDGVEIQNSATGNLIGGTEAGAGNLIAFNTLDGVNIVSGTGNTVLGNSIHSNSNLGIDLGASGVQANDAGDGDSGANELQNFAVLTSAGTDGSKVAVAGTLNTTANTTARIEFFVTDVAAAGNGEGKTYLGSTTVIADGNGDGKFLVSFQQAVSAGQFITSTATVLNVDGSYGSTSEFSANVQVVDALVVDTTADVVDGTTTSVAALLADKGADNKISLREAVLATNADTGADVIMLSDGTYTLTLSGSGEDASVTGDLDVNDALFMVGGGVGSVVIDGGGDGVGGGSSDRVFEVRTGAAFSLLDATLRNGDVGSLGGAVLVKAGTSATLSGVEILDSVGSEGGGIFNAGDLYLRDVRIDGNHATSEGGGLKQDSTATLVNVTVSNNTSTSHGGGIYEDGATSLINVTISGNVTSTGSGGGIHNLGNASLQNVTVVDNTALSSTGGGIDVGGTISTRNTIVANNSASTDVDVSGNVGSLGNNLFGVSAGGSGFQGGDILDIAPTLGALGDNGGPTPTHALLAGSRGIDEGSATGAPAIDQRGNLRGATVDIGAHEFNDVPAAVDDTYSLDEDGTLVTSASSGWTFRTRLTFNNFSQTEDLDEFPILVTLDSSRIDYGQTRDAGEDLRFYDSDGTTLLAHDIESWNEAGTSYVWVKVPRVDGGSSSDFIYMDYGNATAPDGQNAAGVWSDGYRAVYHLEEDPGAGGTVVDSTGLADATNVGSTNTSGVVSDAQDFDGVGQYVNLGQDRDFINGATATTFSAWINPDTTTGSGDILGVTINGAVDTGGSRMTIIRNGADVQVIARTMDDSSDTTSVTTTGGPLVAGSWHYVAATVDYASDVDNIKIYVDGNLEGTFSHDFTNNAIPNTNSTNAALGTDEDGGAPHFDGQIDEARIATVERSADWVAAQYMSITDSFIAFGAPREHGGVLANDVDGNGDALTATLVSGPTNSQAFALNSDGSFSYTPNADFSGVDSFTYQASDGSNTSDIATVTINVAAVNDAPTVNATASDTGTEDTDQVYTHAEMLTLIGAGDVDDADANLSVAITNVVNGSVALSGGTGGVGTTFTFTPDANFVGGMTFDYQVSDDEAPTPASSSVGTATVTLAAVNDAPTVNATASDTGTEDTDQVYTHAEMLTLIGAGDVDDANAALSVAITNVVNGSVALSGGTGGVGTTFTFTPDANFVGGLTFDYQVSDDEAPTPASSAVGTATVTLAAVNDAPTVTATASDTGTEDTDQVYTHAEMLTLIGAGDVDDANAALSVAITNVVNGSVALSGGTGGAGTTFTFTPDANFVGNLTFDYQVSDDEAPTPAGSAVGTATVTLAAVNDAPTVNATASDTGTEDTDQVYTHAEMLTFVGAGDVDDADANLSVAITNVVNGSVALSGGTGGVGTTFTFTPDANFVGGLTFDYQVSDDEAPTPASSAVGTATVTLAAVNDAPTVNATASDTGTEDTDQVYTHAEMLTLIGAGDVDDANASLSVAITNVVNGSVALSGGTGGVGTTFTFTPDADFVGGMTFDYQVSDDEAPTTATSAVGTATVTLAAVNDAPTVNATASDTGTEDTDQVYTHAEMLTLIGAGDVDDADANLSVAITNVVNGSVALSGGTGGVGTTFTFTPDANFVGGMTFDYQVSDDGAPTPASSAVGTATVTLAAVNDAPTVNATASDTGTEDTDQVYTHSEMLTLIGAGDVDDVNASLSIAITNVVNGSVALSGGTGGVGTTFTFTPDANFVGGLSFDYQVSDDEAPTPASSAVGTATVTLAAVNDAPTVNATASDTGTEDTDQVYTHAEMLALIGAGDVDDANAALSVAITNVVNGSVALSGGTGGVGTTFTFTPDANFVGGLTFDYQVSDDEAPTPASSAVGTATVTLAAVNDAPTVNATASDTGTEDTGQVYTHAEMLTLIGAGDVDDANAALSVAITNVVNGSVALSGGTGGVGTAFTFTPDANFVGGMTFDYQVSDDEAPTTATSAVGTATVTLAAVNDAPTVNATASDTGTEDTDQVYTHAEMLTLIGAGDVDDADANLSVAITNVVNGSVALSGGTGGVGTTFTFTPDANFVGGLSFDYQVSDDEAPTPASSAVGTATVTLAAVNDAPTVTATASDTGTEDTDQVYTHSEMLTLIGAGDVDDVNASLSIAITNVVNGSVALSGGTGGVGTTFTFTPDANFVGGLSFDYQVSDDEAPTPASSAVGTATVTLAAVNDAPTVTATASDTGTEDTDQVYTHSEMLTLIGAGDVDDVNASLSIAITNVVNGSVALSGGTGGVGTTFTFTPDANFVGGLSFDYQVSDDEAPTPASSAVGTATVTLAAVNDAPTVNATASDTGTEDTDQVYTHAEMLTLIGAGDVDDANAALSVAITNVVNGSVALSGGTGGVGTTFTFTPDANFVGGLSFDYQVSDDEAPTPASSAAGTATVTLAAVNDAPTVTATASDTGTEDTDQVYTHAEMLTLIGAADVDDANANLSVAITNVVNGSVALSGGTGGVGTTFTFTPDANFVGNLTFDYQVSDDEAPTPAASAVGTATVTLAAVNDAPTVNATASDTGTEDTDQVYTHAEMLTLIGAGDVDDANAALSVTITNVVNGSVALSGGTGGVGTTFTFTPDADFVGGMTFDYQVSDDEAPTPASSAVGTATVTLAAVNDAPTVTATANDTGTEDTDQVYTHAEMLTLIGAGDVDDADAALSVAITNVVNGSVALSGGTGGLGTTFTFTPDANFVGGLSFDYQVSDDEAPTPASSAAGTATVTLAAVNDAPTVNATASDTGTEDTDQVYTHAEMLTLIGAADVDDANAALSVAITNVVNGSVALSGGTGGVGTTFTFTPDADFVGGMSFDYQVSDDEAPTPAASAVGTATVTLAAVNDAPTVNATASDTGTEDTDQVYTHAEMLTLIGAGDVDDANAALSVTITNVVNGSVALSGGTGGVGTTFTFTPDADFVGGLTFDYQVSDDEAPTPASSAVGTATVTLAAVNDAPTVTATANDTGTEDTDQVYTHAEMLTLIGAGDVDDADAALSVAITNVVNGSVALSGGTGGLGTTFTFTPDANFVGGLSFDYQVSDDEAPTPASSAVGTATVTLAAVNDAPTVNATASDTGTEDTGQVYTHAEMLTLVGAADVDDADANLSVAITNVVNGSVALSGGTGGVGTTFTFTPDANFVGGLSFDYQVSDDEAPTPASSAAGTATVTLSAVNDAPTVTATASDTGTEDTDQVYTHAEMLTLIGAGDVDDANAALSVAITNVVNGSVALSGGTGGAGTTFTFTPDANFVGGLGFDYQVSDDEAPTPAISALGTATVTIAAANDAPTVNLTASDTGTEDTDQVYTHAEMLTLVGATDLDDADADLAVAISNVANGSVALSGGSGGAGTSFTFTPDADFVGNLSFDYQVSDDQAPTPASSAVGTATVTLAAVNDAPTVTLANLVTSLPETAPTAAAIKVADIVLSDVDSGTNVLSLAGPDAVHFEIVGTELRLRAGTSLDFESAADAGANHVFDVTVEVDDPGVGGSPDSTAATSLTVSDVDEIPADTISPVAGSPSPERPEAPSPVADNPTEEADAQPTSLGAIELSAVLSPIDEAVVEVDDPESGTPPEIVVGIPPDDGAAFLQGVAGLLGAPPGTATDSGEARQDSGTYRAAKTVLREEVQAPREVEVNILPVPRTELALNIHQELVDGIESMQIEMASSGDSRITEEVFRQNVLKGTLGTLSAGTVTWMLRAGSLLAGVFSAMPMWSTVDPLPILALSTRERRRRQKQMADDDSRDVSEQRLAHILDGSDNPSPSRRAEP